MKYLSALKLSVFRLFAVLMTFSVVCPLYAKVTFLGSAPTWVAPLPSSVLASRDIGVDADNNYYFLDPTQGIVVQRDPSGNETTLFSGLTNARMAVNYKGDVLVADPGTHRLLLQEHTAVGRQLRTLATPQAPTAVTFAVDDSIFYLDQGSLYQIYAKGTAKAVASVPNAVAIAAGPPADSGQSIYVISQEGDSYNMAAYVYYQKTGSLSSATPVPISGTVTAFQVGRKGTYFFQLDRNGGYENFAASSTGSAFSLGWSGGARAGLAYDKDDQLFYSTDSDIRRIQYGRVDIAQSSDWAPGGFLIFATNNPAYDYPRFRATVTGPSFGLDQMPPAQGDFPCYMIDNISTCWVPVYYRRLSSVSDGQFISTAGTIPLYGGAGTFAQLRTIADHQKGSPFPQYAGLTHSPVVAVDGDGTGYTIDFETGALLAIAPDRSTASVLATGFDCPTGIARSVGYVYVTTCKIAGVTRVSGSGQKKNYAGNYPHPSALTADARGNLYIGQNDVIYKIWTLDGSNSLFVDPTKGLDLHGLVGLATDGSGNVYAAYSSGGANGNGAILRITPGGAVTQLQIDIGRLAGLASDLVGDLYFTDSSRKTLGLFTAQGDQLTLLDDLTEPKGVAASSFGVYAVADGGPAVLRSIDDPGFGYNFGDVPVGKTVTGRRYILNVGTGGDWSRQLYISSGDYSSIQLLGVDPYYNSVITSFYPGALQWVDYSFTPQAAGSTSAQVTLSYWASHGSVPGDGPIYSASVIGVGLAPE